MGLRMRFLQNEERSNEISNLACPKTQKRDSVDSLDSSNLHSTWKSRRDV
jgi:hypothetical protein